MQETAKHGDGPGTSPGSGPFEGFGRRFDQHVGTIGPRVEEEVRRVIAYLNDEVVPQVRRNSSEALHTAADHLNRLAEHLDRGRRS